MASCAVEVKSTSSKTLEWDMLNLLIKELPAELALGARLWALNEERISAMLSLGLSLRCTGVIAARTI
jgi:hypothetical protein